MGVMLEDLENNFHGQLFEECPWLCSEGVGELRRLKMLSLLEDLDCFMSIWVKDKKRCNVER